jgi:hypothetical protein
MPRTALTESSPQNLPAIPVPAAGVVVLVIGIAGQITHLGVFFLPALVALTGGAVLLWRERPLRAARGQR